MSNAQKKDESDLNLIASLQADSFIYLEAERFKIEDAYLFLDFFIMGVDENHLKKKKQRYANKINSQKNLSFLIKILIIYILYNIKDYSY